VPVHHSAVPDTQYIYRKTKETESCTTTCERVNAHCMSFLLPVAKNLVLVNKDQFCGLLFPGIAGLIPLRGVAVSFACCHVKRFVTDRSLVQGSSTVCVCVIRCNSKHLDLE
jgi:hypothetical protein